MRSDEVPVNSTGRLHTGARIAETVVPMLTTRSWTLTARLTADETRTKGVIMAVGGIAAGMALYLKDGVPVFEYHYSGQHTAIRSAKPLPAGETTVELDFNYLAGGPGRTTRILLKVDGEKVGEGRVAAAFAARPGADAVGTRENGRQPATFEPPPGFTGLVQGARIDVR